MLHVGKIKCVSTISSPDANHTFLYLLNVNVQQRTKEKETIQKVLVHRASTLKITNRFKIRFVDENFINVK